MPTAVLQIQDGEFVLLNLTLPEPAPDLPAYEGLTCGKIWEQYGDANFRPGAPRLYGKTRPRQGQYRLRKELIC